MPVTQQYVKNGNKYYLLDLYFPQINFGVEIDEAHHLNEENKESDKVREEGIKTAIACEEVRIPIYNENGKKRSYKDICQDIDSVVELIQKKIKEKQISFSLIFFKYIRNLCNCHKCFRINRVYKLFRCCNLKTVYNKIYHALIHLGISALCLNHGRACFKFH